MDAIRLGQSLRVLRRRRAWRQEDLAVRAGVSPSTVSRIESGRVGAMPVDTLERVAAALDARLDLVARWHGEGLDRLLDAAHADLVESLVRRLERGGWEAAVEVSFAIRGERGSIDVLARHLGAEIVGVFEVKSTIPDVQATIHAFDRKSRLAREIAAERGWPPSAIVRFLAVADDRTVRRRVDQHAATFRSAFPLRGHEAARWVDDPITARSLVEGAGRSPSGAVRSGVGVGDGGGVGVGGGGGVGSDAPASASRGAPAPASAGSSAAPASPASRGAPAPAWAASSGRPTDRRPGALLLTPHRPAPTHSVIASGLVFLSSVHGVHVAGSSGGRYRVRVPSVDRRRA